MTYFCELSDHFIEIALQHGCSPVSLLHTFRAHFPKNTCEELFLLHTFYYLLQECIRH